MEVREVLCLANSKKRGGRCMAGLYADGGGWVRPVSLEREGTLTEETLRLTDGAIISPLDVVRVQFGIRRPEPHQPENRLITHAPWERACSDLADAHIALLRDSLVRGPELLGDCETSVPYLNFLKHPAHASLALIAPDNLQWVIRSNAVGERRTRIAFSLSGQIYQLPVTETCWAERLKEQPAGIYPMETAGITPDWRVLVTISLSEPFQFVEKIEPFCYKLAAAVIPVPAEWFGD